MPIFFDDHYGYRQHIVDRCYSDAIYDALALIDQRKQQAPASYPTDHKGTIFYLMGCAAFAAHNYGTATHLFDSAASEDLKNYPARTNSPALHFMRLEDVGQIYTASGLITHVRILVDGLIGAYNNRPGSRQLTLADFCNVFLAGVLAGPPHRRALSTTLISYIAEWEYKRRLFGIGAEGSRESFFLHLFRGCLLFESLLKENPKRTVTQDTLRPVLSFLHRDLGIPANLSISQRRGGFDAVVRSMSPNMSTSDAIQVTGKARNTLGHNVVWTSHALTLPAYDDLAENIGVACLHAISNLYR